MDELPKAGWVETVRLLFDYLSQYRVEGDSMMPTLKPGARVLVDEKAKVRARDIVIARHPFKSNVIIVKRIREIDANGNYFLISDNPEDSTDSRTFGAVSSNRIIGKVVSRLTD
ncbi:MAG: nickel-type superoxide dismutase maturation protease [Acidobacteria bacterium]|nr:nickel-type superoxide dismutase maturation protease [Acidobacteriota bacterium]